MIKNISPNEAIEKLNQGGVLVDVRELDEINEVGYDIENQKVIPLSEFKDKFNILPQDADLVLACRSGVRSMQAAMFLADNGYVKLSNLDGGILRWGSERKPTK